MAEGSARVLRLRTESGYRHVVPAFFARHLGESPVVRALPADVPIILVMTGGGAHGLELPRLIAARTGREVWAHSGTLRLEPSPDGRSVRITVVKGDPTRPDGVWVRSLPGDLGGTSAAGPGPCPGCSPDPPSS
ncbi:hypothetical protein ABZV75_36210 [Streptomyces flaveolus]|uniref:hypothetical protein n=1 Tax=Streptomyces flaveolus TaxID=67297 RepID=UPI0033BD0861